MYFGLVFGAGFILGAIRVTFFVPMLGIRYAELLESPFMLVVVVVSASHIVRRYRLAPALIVRLQVGLAALAMLILAELLLSVVLQDRSISQYIASRDPISGTVYLAMLLLFALMPSILIRARW